MEKFIQSTKYFILNIIVLAVPFFFLNITQEYFTTNKIYLLGFGFLLLMLVDVIHVLVSKKISWEKRPLDNFVLLFLTSMAISIVLSSPNKIQAILNPNFGLVMMISLAILYFYLSRLTIRHGLEEQAIKAIALVLSFITIIFYFQPFKNVTLPQNFVFLKSPAFSPVGSQLDSVILLGFFLIMQIKYLLTKKRSILHYLFLIVNLLAILLNAYSLIKSGAVLFLPPFRLSWYAALEILKNPQTALIGVGPDNFSTVFTRVKDFAYNQSSIWQINSFNVSRSAVLQIFTETGILGLLTFGLLTFNVLKQLTKGNFVIYYVLFVILFFPSSLIVWFLFFVLSAQIISQQHNDTSIKQSIDLSNLLPIYIGFVIVSVALIGVSGYFLGRTFASEYYYKKSLDGMVNNSAQQVYDNQRQAIILNPYIEKYRSSFAQTNLLIANNLSKKKPKEITEKDRQTIAQAIQAGIMEGKTVISLNPQKAEGWQNLATIYLNIINTATDADVWSISAYQRAILADPQNPSYRVGIGGVYYYQKKYNEAIKFFEQAISLKPDWANSNYNYAWANFQVKNYPIAVNAMENALNMLNSKTNKVDYEKVKKELEEFKKMLPKEDNKEEPKIELPKDASPEAK